MIWAYGITTVPSRLHTTLPTTIASLARAGFNSPRLFIDGASLSLAAEISQLYSLSVTARDPVVRIAGNWLLSMLELYIRNPSADRFVIFQDDIICSSNMLSYLQRCRYPDGSASTPRGYLNLITYPDNEPLIPTANNHQLPGWFISNQRGRGAQALVFSRAAVTALLSSEYMISRYQDPERGWRNIDGGIVSALRNLGWKEYVHYPSLVFHIGDVSTFEEYKSELKVPHAQQPHATTFRGEEFDLLTLLS